MRALRCHQIGPVDGLVLEEDTEKTPGPREVAINVHAAALNYRDALMVLGEYQDRPPLPFVPGTDCAGTVRTLGKEVRGLQTGDRVAMVSGHGALADQIIVKASQLLPIPDAVPLDMGAATPTAYGTALHALRDRGHIQPGERLLILGAGGGVGSACVELGKYLGAEVVAGAGSPQTLAWCRDQGIAVIDYGTKDLVSAVKALGYRFDVIVDLIGGEPGNAAIRCLNWAGRLLALGFTAGAIPAHPNNRLLLRGTSVVGVNFGAHVSFETARYRANMAEIFEGLAGGTLSPVISRRYPLAQAVEGFLDLLEHRAHGKIVITMQADDTLG